MNILGLSLSSSLKVFKEELKDKPRIFILEYKYSECFLLRRLWSSHFWILCLMLYSGEGMMYIVVPTQVKKNARWIS